MLNKRGMESQKSPRYGKDVFDVNDRYIHVAIPFDKEAMENHTMSRLALRKGDGIHPSFGEEGLKKLIKSNGRIAGKGIAEYFGVSPRMIQRYRHQIKFVRYVGSGKSGHREIE